ncbi:MAG: hypothetical protein H6R19_2256 [Proteobacteria bacterium]|nr:hypothetical protein [Pseudomonadota bacterium]
MQKLFLFVLVLIGIWYVRRLLQRNAEKDAQQPAVRSEETRSEAICECRHCGVLVPESEGLVADGEFFCSSEHARAAGRKV